MSIVIIDNYDSFTYNLAHLVKELGCEVTVLRNDCFKLEELECYDKIILSPGPGIPEEAGLLLDVIKTYARKKSILGVCLGHQAIGEVFGAKLKNLKEVFHGVETPIKILEEGILFKNMEKQINVGRYHSWIVSKEDFPKDLIITAISNEDEIMAIRHKKYKIYGIQFHPESILTPKGKQIILNWIKE